MIQKLFKYSATSIFYLGVWGFLVLGSATAQEQETLPSEETQGRPRGFSMPASEKSASSSSTSTPQSHLATDVVDSSSSDGTGSHRSAEEVFGEGGKSSAPLQLPIVQALISKGSSSSSRASQSEEHPVRRSTISREEVIAKIGEFLKGKVNHPEYVTSALEATATVLKLPMDWEFLNSVVETLKHDHIAQRLPEGSLQADFDSFSLGDLTQEQILEKVDVASISSTRQALYKSKIYGVSSEFFSNSKNKLVLSKKSVEILEAEESSSEFLRNLTVEDFMDMAVTYEEYLHNLWRAHLENPLTLQGKWPELSRLMAKVLQYFYCCVLSDFKRGGCTFNDLLLRQENFYAYKQFLETGFMTGLITHYTFGGPYQFLPTVYHNPLFDRGSYEFYGTQKTLEAANFYRLSINHRQGGAPYLGTELGQWGVEPDSEEPLKLLEQAYEALTDDNVVKQRTERAQRLPGYVIGILNNLVLEYKKRGTLEKFLEKAQFFLKTPLANIHPVLRYNIERR